MKEQLRIDELVARVERLEHELESCRRFEGVLGNAPVCVHVFDADGYSLYVNQTELDFTKIPSPDLIYGQFNCLTDPGIEAMGLREAFENAYRGETARFRELLMDFEVFDERWEASRRKAWIELLIYPLFDGDEIVGVASFKSDVTARKQVEQALISAQRQEGLALLAGGIAHDFNNLLVGILGNASLGLQHTGDTPETRECFEEIHGAAEQAAILTRQLLAYAGKGRFVVKEVSLSALVEDMLKVLRLSIPREVAVRVESDGPAIVRADAAQIRQVILNLISNAGEAIGDKGGVITVMTGTLEADPSYLEGSFAGSDLNPGRYSYLEVSDTGVGMPSETVEAMFDPFFTTKPTGHGLGLAATLGILKGHNGAIRVYSEPNRGTTVKLLFPWAGDVAVPEPTVPEPVPQRGKLTILVVDDEQRVRTVLRRALEKAGHEVLVARGGVEALATFETRQKSIDLVILDMTMPDLDGAEVFRRMRHLDAKVRVLLTSGFNSQDATSRFAGKGLAGFLPKPFTVQDLLRRVAEVTSEPSIRAPE